MHVDSWRSTYGGHRPRGASGRTGNDRQEANWRSLLADRRQIAFVAEDPHGRIIGFVPGGPERNGDATHHGEFYAIYFLQSCQGQGLGLGRPLAELVECFLSEVWQSMLLCGLGRTPRPTGLYEALGGVRIKHETISIGGTELIEIAYGWTYISPLTTAS